MKNLKLKNIIIAIFAILIISTGIFSIYVFSSNSSEIDYEKPIPLGAGLELIEGLNEQEIKKAEDNYNKFTSSEYGKLHNINYNFMESIDKEKYYGGSYFEGDPRIYDENGEILVNEKGKPLTNYDNMKLHILVTDLKIVPKEITNPKVFFHEAKYSESELEYFIKIVGDTFPDEMIAGWIETKTNKIEICFIDGFDVEKLTELIPEEAYNYTIVDSDDVGGSVASGLLNGSELRVVSSGSGSIGFPVAWDSGTGSTRVVGWLIAGHVATGNNLDAKRADTNHVLRRV